MKEHLVWAAVVCLIGAALGGVRPDDDAKSRVSAILAKVKPYDTASRDAAEEALVAGGVGLAPEIRSAIEKAEETQRAALEAALVRLTWQRDPRKRISGWLAAKVGAEAAERLPEPALLRTTALETLFPDTLFYAVVFRQYPVAMAPPAPLSAQNVLAYEKDGSIKLLTSPNELKAHFMRSIGTITTQGEGKRIAAAWLRLSQEFSQDGFFRFTIPEEQLKVTYQPSGGMVATGKALVTPKGGDSGEIEATLTFAGQGNAPRRLVIIKERRDVKAGVRPICQATKLLDVDPIVRRMAEQDLLVMGRAAGHYIMEQRGKASPELRREIERVWNRIVDEKR